MRSIPMPNVIIYGLTGGAATNELFIADANSNVVHSFDEQTGVLNAIVNVTRNEILHNVAYIAESDTLLIATCDSRRNGFFVYSLNRTNASSQWIVRDKEKFAEERLSFGRIYLRVLSDGTVFCGESGTDGVHVCRVETDRSIQNCERLTLTDKHSGFDVQLVGNERRLAAALRNKKVALFRLESERFVQLLSIDPFESFPGARPINPLFIGNNLVVEMMEYNSANCTSILTYSIADSGLQLQNDPRLIKLEDVQRITNWCFANGKLFTFVYENLSLVIYSVVTE